MIDLYRKTVLVPVAVDSPRRYTGAMNAIDERACGKPGCDNFEKPGLNIVGHGWFVTKSGRRRRYRCTVCGGTLSTNTGTAYRGLRCSRREFDQVASLRVEGVSISATARVTGHSLAQYNLGLRYANGRGVTQDDVSAHMWFNLAAAQSTGEQRERIAAARDAVAARMTREDLSEAQRRAREWSPE